MGCQKKSKVINECIKYFYKDKFTYADYILYFMAIQIGKRRNRLMDIMHLTTWL